MEVTAPCNPSDKKPNAQPNGGDADHPTMRIRKKQKTWGSLATAAADPDKTPAPPGGGGTEAVRAGHAAGSPPPCTGGDPDGGASQPARARQGPGSPEVIIIEDDEEEAQRELEFEREIAALKAEIARLVALAEELKSQQQQQGKK